MVKHETIHQDSFFQDYMFYAGNPFHHVQMSGSFRISNRSNEVLLFILGRFT